MYVRVKARILNILFQEHSEYSEIQIASMLLMWGVWLAFNPFNKMQEGNPYRVMAEYAPDEVWCVLFLILGLVHLASLTQGWGLVRLVVTMIEFSWWFLLFLMFSFSNHSLPAVPTTLVLAGWSGWNHIRLALRR